MSLDAACLRCLCDAIHEAPSLLAAQHFPIETELCHCNPCRQTSGALACTYARLAGAPSTQALEACTLYSPAGRRVDRYFCSSCGTRTFDHAVDADRWFACSGTIEPRDREGQVNVTKVIAHAYVADTKDGGLARLMPRLGGRDVPCYAERDDLAKPGLSSDDLEKLISSTSNLSRNPDSTRARLPAGCHCGSIQFSVLPPDPTKAYSPNVASRLRANNTKWLAVPCACNYCRRALGFPLAPNMYAAPENIIVHASDGIETSLFDYRSTDSQISEFESKSSTKTLQALLPALKFDFSSPGIRRSWCGMCGASVFFERRSRPEVVNVTLGILRADEGCLAGRWVEFEWESIWFKELGTEWEVVEALEKVDVAWRQ